ncbi:MAG: flavodoxin-dependent (E)-4-hydroxy-3-methylbut-2-enyl-diphosphate synthase [Vulcanimicrobiota bacterium]
MIQRKTTRKIKVREAYIGGDAPVLVQSMTNTLTSDIQATMSQVFELEAAGCELVRCGVPDIESARALKEIVRSTALPVCADIHFDADLAREAISQGVHKLRINPGNLKNKEEVRDIALRCKEAGIPIRIGVNAGSLDTKILEKYGGITPAAMVESAQREIELLESVGFADIIISLKASRVPLCVESYRMMSDLYDYPLHIGITEAGTLGYGSVKSAVGLGILLYQGIGDTLRVSLTDNPVKEMEVAWDILKALEIRKRGPELVSCPTCARSQIDVISMAREVEARLRKITAPITVAVMGCVVNGPGEAREADVGLAGGKGRGVIFRQGRKIKTVDEQNLVDELFNEIDSFLKQK